MPQTVAIFGGGVSGLTAAHELALRGFTVNVYEKRDQDAVGGKARTQPFPSATLGTLPGEHGFRFFPHFYSLVRDTMRRIPIDTVQAAPAPLGHPTGRTVIDNLVSVPVDGIGRRNEPFIAMPRRWDVTTEFVVDAIRFFFDGLEIPQQDQLHIGARLLKYFTSGDRRRLGQFEQQSFWDFVHADALTAAGQEMILNMPKVFVAMNAREGNARTLGNVLFLILRDMMRHGSESDHILAGPTSKMWLIPWRRWLEHLGVVFRYGAKQALADLECDVGARRISSARLTGGTTVHADHFIVAVPLEVAQGIARGNTDLRQFVQFQALADIHEARALGWMVGVQFYLKTDVRTQRGHLGWRDCTWALTGISQAQFWAPNDFAQQYGNGAINGLVSINVSDWRRDGVFLKKPAEQCTRAELFEELLGQTGALVGGRPILDRSNIAAWHVDDDLSFDGPGSHARVVGNESPLLIHPPGLWAQRPEPVTEIENLFLAADYVRNDMDLATMEGANQAAREAVNALLQRSGSTQPPCRTVAHLAENEWPVLQAVKAWDDWLYDHGREPEDEGIEAGIDVRAAPPAVAAPKQAWERLATFERWVQGQARNRLPSP